jgi:hypothetical protein
MDKAAKFFSALIDGNYNKLLAEEANGHECKKWGLTKIFSPLR